MRRCWCPSLVPICVCLPTAASLSYISSWAELGIVQSLHCSVVYRILCSLSSSSTRTLVDFVLFVCVVHESFSYFQENDLRAPLLPGCLEIKQHISDIHTSVRMFPLTVSSPYHNTPQKASPYPVKSYKQPTPLPRMHQGSLLHSAPLLGSSETSVDPSDTGTFSNAM